MISEADFYKQVMQEFKELNTRITSIKDEIYEKMDKLHGETNEQITDLCNKISSVKSEVEEVKTEIGTHLAINEALEKEDQKKVDKRDRKFYVIMALMSAGFTIFEISKSYFGV